MRLLVSFRENDRVVHAKFWDIPEFLRSGDLLVVNDSATLSAALQARRPDGSQVALHLSTRLPAGLWIVEPRQTQVTGGEILALPGGGSAHLLVSYPGSTRLWIAQLDLPAPVFAYLGRYGRPIAYPYVRGEWPIEMYQTVYARVPGSAEMPSAGRAFTPEVMACAIARGIGIASLSLHTGIASLERDEPLIEEFYRVSVETAEAVNNACERGGRIIAVGTTVVRALESSVDERGRIIASQGWTDLVTTPERGVRTVDGLLTGFHEPRASHTCHAGGVRRAGAPREGVSGRARRRIPLARVRGLTPHPLARSIAYGVWGGHEQEREDGRGSGPTAAAMTHKAPQRWESARGSAHSSILEWRQG